MSLMQLCHCRCNLLWFGFDITLKNCYCLAIVTCTHQITAPPAFLISSLNWVFNWGSWIQNHPKGRGKDIIRVDLSRGWWLFWLDIQQQGKCIKACVCHPKISFGKTNLADLKSISKWHKRLVWGPPWWTASNVHHSN